MVVWVVVTSEAHGEDVAVMGVYASEEAARAAMEALPNMRVYVQPDKPGELGGLLGDPVDMDRYPAKWAYAESFEVQGESPPA